MSAFCDCFDCEACSSEDEEMGGDLPRPPGVMTLESAALHLTEKDSNTENLRSPQISITKQLFSMTGYNLALFANGKVKGTREHYSPYAILKVTAIAKGEVQLLAVESGLFVSMTRRGRLYGESDSTKINTIWVETISGGFFNYISKKYAHKGWYLAIKKSGKPKRGKKTAYGQRAVQFLPRHPLPVSSH